MTSKAKSKRIKNQRIRRVLKNSDAGTSITGGRLNRANYGDGITRNAFGRNNDPRFDEGLTS